jgi:hypothetical protein
MGKTGENHLLSMLQSPFRPGQFLRELCQRELCQIVAAHIFEFAAFEQISDAFLRIESRSIGQ